MYLPKLLHVFNLNNSAFQTLIILVNWFLFMDLYLMIKDPFNGRGAMYKMYYAILLLCFVVSIVVMQKTKIYWWQLDATDTCKAEKQFTILVWIMGSLVVLTLVCVALVVRMLAKKGTSPKLKRLVCYRHFAYMVLYLLMFFNALYPVIG